MRETAEFRIPEEHAKRFLAPDVGVVLGESVRKVEVSTDEPLYEQIPALDPRLRKHGDRFFLGLSMSRSYTDAELGEAELFRLVVDAVFEPTGEMCGTVYDESDVCRHVFSSATWESPGGEAYEFEDSCGAGRRQVSELILDLRRAPKRADIARTIADEWIVSQRLAELLVDARLTGFALRRVRHKARYDDDAVDFATVPSGRELLRRARDEAVEDDSWAFSVWLNRAEQRPLVERARREHASAMQAVDSVRRWTPPVWHQLVVTSPPVGVAPQTRFGVSPVENGSYRCPFGHVVGLNVLSEVFVRRSEYDGSDLAATRELVGARRGELVAAPLLLVSPRFRGLLDEHRIRGARVEIAHLV